VKLKKQKTKTIETMHLADALISPAVAAGGYAVAVSLTALSIRRMKSESSSLLPLTGVLGAFILVAQMVNFSIPGTGSSGHIVGGVLLSVLLGPWAAFLTLTSVIVIQCLLFADGGLLALGCNVVNMAAMSCLVAYPLLYVPLSKRVSRRGGLLALSVITCSVSALLGALGVVADVSLSGIASLPPLTFVSFMLPIHLVIGIMEGIITHLVVSFVRRSRPSLVAESDGQKVGRGGVMVAFAMATLLLLVVALLFSSSEPDGLEWSVQNTMLVNE
jgi:cobalt/nickel transport system permease protein